MGQGQTGGSTPAEGLYLRHFYSSFGLPLPGQSTAEDTVSNNGYVERAYRGHTEEFYEVTDSSFNIAELRAELVDWEQTCNAVRPHQSLNYLTPLEFLGQWKEK